MSFAHYRRVKMEPDSYRGVVGSGAAGWGWGASSQTAGFSWFRGFHQDDTVTALPAAPPGSSHSPDLAGSGVYGQKASRNEASYDKRTPPGRLGQLPPPPGITVPPLLRLPPPPESSSAGNDSGSTGSCSGHRLGSFSSPETAQQHPEPVGNDPRKPGSGHSASDPSTSSSDVMLGNWTSSNVSSAGQGMATPQCQATPPAPNALSVHSVPHSSASVVGAFAGVGSSLAECGGGAVAVSGGEDALCPGYDTARATFFSPSGEPLCLSVCTVDRKISRYSLTCMH